MRLASTLCLLLSLGCGARTGLDTPDGGTEPFDRDPPPVADTRCGEGGTGLATPLELVTPARAAASVAVRGTRVYWAQWVFDGDVSVVSRDGEDARRLADGRQAVNALAADAEGVWLVDVGRTTPGGELAHLSLSGGARTLLRGLNQPGDLTIAGGRLWVAEGSNSGSLADTGIGAVLRVDPADGTVQRVVADRGLIGAVAADASHLWWLDTRRGTLGRVRLDGSAVEDRVTGLERPRHLSVASGRILFTDRQGRSLVRLLAEGSSPEVLYESDRRIVALETDDRAVYFLEARPGDPDGRLVRLAHRDGELSVLAATQVAPRGLALDANRVYWTGGEGDGGYVRAICKPE